MSLLLGTAVILSTATMAETPLTTTASEQLSGIMKEHHKLLSTFEATYESIAGESARAEFWRKNYPRPEQFYPRLMTLAQEHRSDPAAAEALIWIATHSSNEPVDSATQRKAFDLLRRDHILSDKLPLVFEYADDEFLRFVLDKSPRREVRGQACFSLAEKGLWKLRRVTRWRDENPDWKQRTWLKQTAFAYLVNADVDQLTRANEKLLERVVHEFAGVPIAGRRNGRTLGTIARSHLHEIRDLAIGKPAPNVRSVTLQDMPVCLADLKGRIVVLDVWATWCGPCVAMIPHQRKLVSRLKDKPFTLVSISVDDKPETVVQFLKGTPMPWTHWFNGPEAGIIADLNVWSYPTIYVLDEAGIIRHKDIRGKLLDRAVDDLLKKLPGR